MGFRQYTIPRYDSTLSKWVYEILDNDEVLIEQVEHDTEEDALTDHRKRFIDDVLNDRVMKQTKRGVL